MSDLLTSRASAPLADLRVIAVEQFGAGPFGTLQLADLGADVIKIEDPDSGGDVSRYIPPFQEGEDSIFFEAFNRGKRSVSLDLRRPEGRKVFEDLVREADAVFSNLRGDGVDKLGLIYDRLKHVNPRIVCCSLSGFGNTGPRRTEGAYDYVIQGLAGWMSLTGGPDEPPMKSGLSLVDLAGGYVAAIALVSSVWRARREGVGGDCDLSLFDTALSLLTYQGTWAASRGYETERLSNSAHPSIVPFQVFPSADGYLVIACAKEKFWVRLIALLGRDDLAADERMATFAGRRDHRSFVQEELTREFLKRPTNEWVDQLREAGIPAQPVNLVIDALDDPQVHARDGPVPVTRGPFLGEHTETLLRELCGYDDAEIQRLTDAQAIAQPTTSVRQSATGAATE
jgi:crotonobetainyl-CoA:carnitine CoA-transferase CaiB-like acyl-CoA transferase